MKGKERGGLVAWISDSRRLTRGWGRWADWDMDLSSRDKREKGAKSSCFCRLRSTFPCFTLSRIACKKQDDR
jgi:hypothetical protein